MVNKKHQSHINDVFIYIYNRLLVNTDIDKLVDEVITKFSTELAWYKVLPEMHENFVRELCLQAYLYTTKTIYGSEEGGTNA